MIKRILYLIIHALWTPIVALIIVTNVLVMWIPASIYYILVGNSDKSFDIFFFIIEWAINIPYIITDKLIK